ncbi:transposase [Klebsiella pneumoniae]|uniref:transposase n=1 Tax=Klebsiella pneumoniae TaxID=573 RepID=UPI00388E2EDB
MKSLTAVRKKSPNYPVEFKIKMVELSHRPEISVAQLAREHGINDNLLFKWRQYWREKNYVLLQQQKTTCLSCSR